MFYDVYCALCEKNGLTPSGAASKIGFNRASVTVWKNTGKAPKQELLLKIADYFGVTTDYLLTGEETKKVPTLTPKDERDIERRLSEVLEELERGQDGLMFSGEAMDETTRELLAASLRNSMEIGKTLAKKKYTPKKYRKED
nr:MAG TPA: repressor protein [Caudoviricetes sp.]